MGVKKEGQPRIVIIGGVAGGASAAARARRANANAEITILEKGPHVSFANCGLPYHIGGEIEDREQLLVASPELFWERFRIRVKNRHEVRSIDRKAKTVTGLDDQGKEFKQSYDRLILAVGSEPFKPPFYKDSADNVFQLWTLEDMDRILAYMKKFPCRTATIVGGGFIGLEVVEQLVRLGVTVTLVERSPQVLTPIDPEMASFVEEQLLENNVDLKLGGEVNELLESGGRVTAVKLTGGQTVSTDLVIVGAGVRPRIHLAQQAELELGASGAIRVNEFCQTNDPFIYAVGDASEYQHGVLGKPIMNPLAGPANRAGRVAGNHAATAGQESSHGGLQMSTVFGTAVVRVFDVSAAITGLNERRCRENQIEFRTATIQAAHHASYYPGAQSLVLKLLYSPESRKILGAQAVGAEGVDKRIDVIATAMHFGGTIDDLACLDLAYAPPFGAAKDPIHMAAFAAQNDLADYPDLLPAGTQLADLQVVDVRSERELEKLPLPDAIHIPIDQLADRYTELDSSKSTVTVCHSGKRGHVAACWLRGKGFQQVSNLTGGMFIRRKFERPS